MSKVQQLNAQQISDLLSQIQSQGVDLNSAEAIKAFSDSYSAKPAVAQKEVKTSNKAPIADSDKCCARIWGKTGSGNERCETKRVKDSDFCSKHAAKAALGLIPKKNEQGQWVGLECGRIDQEIPFLDAEGLIAIRWNNPDIKAKILEIEGNVLNSKSSPYTNEWYKFTNNKKVPSVTRVRKAKAASEAAAPAAEAPVAVKGKKGKKTSKKSAKPSNKDMNIKGPVNSFMAYSNEKRAEVKAQLLADFILANADATDAEIKKSTSVGAIAKAIGQKWASLSDEEKAPYKAIEEADKLRYNNEKTAWEAQQALVAVTDETETEEDSQEQEEQTPTQDSDENTISADEININGIDYLYDSNTGTIYDLDCNELGKLVDGKIVN